VLQKRPKWLICQNFKKKGSGFKLWVWKGVDFLDEYVINNLKENFGEKISPDIARYNNV